MCLDIMFMGFKGVENVNICIGDSVVIFVQGFIGLCVIVGVWLLGVSMIIVIDGNVYCFDIVCGMGVDVMLNFRECDVIEEIFKFIGGCGVDVLIEVFGM